MANRPRWSPDGQRIAFYSDASGNRDVYVMRKDGSELKRLTTDPSIGYEPRLVSRWQMDLLSLRPKKQDGFGRCPWRVARRSQFRGPRQCTGGVTRRQVPLLRQRRPAFGEFQRAAARKLKSSIRSLAKEGAGWRKTMGSISSQIPTRRAFLTSGSKTWPPARFGPLLRSNVRWGGASRFRPTGEASCIARLTHYGSDLMLVENFR